MGMCLSTVSLNVAVISGFNAMHQAKALHKPYLLVTLL